MKLSANTLEVLKNFSSINSGILIKAGKQLRTISTNKAVLAEANIAEEFPKEVGIYDLNKLLGVLSLHDEADVHFEDQYLAIGGVGGRSRTRIRYTEAKLILAPPNKNINLPSADLTFAFSQDDLNWVEKVGAVLKCPYLVIESKYEPSNDTSEIVVSAADVKGEIVDDSSLTVGKYEGTQPFKFVLKVENLKLLAGSYKVEISSKGISRFTNEKAGVTYFIAVENSFSHFGNKE
jgi:hypothetical protein